MPAILGMATSRTSHLPKQIEAAVLAVDEEEGEEEE